ncbi:MULTISPECIES: hypothetical protein [Rhizobium/Agrobacterium group]|uniref:hypothetical protein n=1 Tax=Rhizobium/Agrobacterium group TaxID=227290 RepID=UPI00107EF6F0|nr:MULTISPECIES: hypothetical protein [Rhizobium/Agrobacterium group]MBB4404046.1 hypothetical protein [Agrobacterium radiobacter]MBB5590198.1 hypothetical protein [Agrobacterium radiobacter]
MSFRRAKQGWLFLSIYCLTIMMLRILAFLNLCRQWRHELKQHLSFSGAGFHKRPSPLSSANFDSPAGDPSETDDGARRPVSWLGLGQSFSAVDVADCDRARLPAE